MENQQKKHRSHLTPSPQIHDPNQPQLRKLWLFPSFSHPKCWSIRYDSNKNTCFTPISSKHQATPFHSASSLGTKIWCHPNIRAASISDVANKSPKIPSGFCFYTEPSTESLNIFDKGWIWKGLKNSNHLRVLYKSHQKISRCWWTNSPKSTSYG